MLLLLNIENLIERSSSIVISLNHVIPISQDFLMTILCPCHRLDSRPNHAMFLSRDPPLLDYESCHNPIITLESYPLSVESIMTTSPYDYESVSQPTWLQVYLQAHPHVHNLFYWVSAVNSHEPVQPALSSLHRMLLKSHALLNFYPQYFSH